VLHKKQRKLRNGSGELPGRIAGSINFTDQRLTIDLSDDTRADVNSTD